MIEVDSTREGYSRIADIRRDKPLSVSLPIGAVVYAVRGQLWITQEGLYDDVIIEAGERFAIERKGLAVITATSPVGVAYLAAPHSGHALGRIPAAFFESVTRRAVDLRRRELNRLAALAGSAITRFVRRVWSLARVAIAGPNAPRPHGR